MGLRKEQRKLVTLPATLCGVDLQERSFIQPASIRNISGRGILLEAPHCRVKIGDSVVLRCGDNKGRFQVIWIANDPRSRGKLVGLQHLLATALHWDLDLPAPGPDHFFRPRLRMRRRADRMALEFPVEVRFLGSNVPMWSTTTDITEEGCFVKMVNVVPLDTKVELALWLDQAKVWIQGVVVTNVAGFGTGVAFQAMPHEAKSRLAEMIAERGIEVPDRRSSEYASQQREELEAGFHWYHTAALSK